MRLLLSALALATLVTGALAGDALAQVQVNPYYRGGTYVQPHFRTYPNATPYDNYGYYRRNNHVPSGPMGQPLSPHNPY